MIFGIDLGTTNSLICNDYTGFKSELVPSCVNFDTGAVGAAAYEDTKAVRSYKTDMCLAETGKVPIEASARVLKKLSTLALNAKEVVISVPAYFTEQQREATLRAAAKAGLDVKALVNEPTAAAIYIAQQRKSVFLVMDLGGGTFDVSIIDSRYGMFDVQATDGCILGGDNLDKAIMKFFVKKYKLPLHHYNAEQRAEFLLECTRIKIDMCVNVDKTGTYDLTAYGGPKDAKFTPTDIQKLTNLVFDKTIQLAQKVLVNNIPENENVEILLVGGSTKNPYYRRLIESSLKYPIAPLTYNPDEVVGQGAALYARLYEEGKLVTAVSDVTKALSIGLADGTVDFVIPENSKVPTIGKTMVHNSEDTDTIHLMLFQGNSPLAQDDEYLGMLNIPLGEEVKEGKATVYVTVEVDISGRVKLIAQYGFNDPYSITIER